MKRLPISSLLLAALPLFPTAAMAQQASQAEDFSNTLFGKIAIALVSAVLSLIGGYLLLYIKEKREPSKRISYNVGFKKGMLGIEERLSQYLSVTYKGRPAEKITYVKCNLLNSGSSIIRSQQIRFEFPKKSEILDCQVDPLPPKEVGLIEREILRDQTNERTYFLSYFQKARPICFHFVVAGDTISSLQLFGFNEDEDVEVSPGDISSAADDKNILERFILIYILSLFVPELLLSTNRFSGGLGSIANVIFYFVSLIAIAPCIPTITRIFSGALISLVSNRENTISIDARASSGNILIASNASAQQNLLPKQKALPTVDDILGHAQTETD